MRFSTFWCKPMTAFSARQDLRLTERRHGADRRGPRLSAIYKDMGAVVHRTIRTRRLRCHHHRRSCASFGARTAVIAKVKNDQIGGLYTHDIRAAGVAFETRAAAVGPATGCSYIR